MNKLMIQSCTDGTTAMFDVRIDKTDEGRMVTLSYSPKDMHWTDMAKGQPVAIMDISEKRDIIDITFDPEGEDENRISLNWGEMESVGMLYDIYQSISEFKNKNILLREDDDS